MNDSFPLPPLETDLRAFAIQVVKKLTTAGHRALWAGGCVRDQLRSVPPKDYDVATSAKPDEVQSLFGRRHTLAIGKQFGVIVVLSSHREHRIEVATFRRDLEYTDGRRPMGVEYTTAEEDARRRDFTVNGLFYDPIVDEVIDYVGGQADLRAKVIRAIGVPHDRFAEDKLRMLRAVRFATVLDYAIEPLTAQAISELGAQLTQVSAERIAGELRLILAHERRAPGVATLHELGLLSVILPEVTPSERQPNLWSETLDSLTALSGDEHPWEAALALLFLQTAPFSQQTTRRIADAAGRLKLTNRELQRVTWIVRHFRQFSTAAAQPWPSLQRLMICEHVPTMLSVLRACSGRHPEIGPAMAFCEQKLSLPPDELNPHPLLTGDDLVQLGIPTGAVYSTILTSVRDAQLSGEIQDHGQAIALAQSILARQS